MSQTIINKLKSLADATSSHYTTSSTDYSEVVGAFPRKVIDLMGIK